MSDDGHPSRRSPFGEALARLMTERGLSYRRLATCTGLSGGYLNHLVHGNRPVPANDVIANVAGALEVPPETFRDYRMRVVVEHLQARPELVERSTASSGRARRRPDEGRNGHRAGQTVPGTCWSAAWPNGARHLLATARHRHARHSYGHTRHGASRRNFAAWRRKRNRP